MTTEPFPGQYPGTVSAPPDLGRLVPISDLVCRGRVVRVTSETAVTYRVEREDVLFRRKVASVAVQRVHLGDIEVGATIDVEFLEPDIPAALTTLLEGEDAVLFLVDTGGRYRLADHATGKILLGDPQAMDPVRRVVAESAASTDQQVSSAARAILDDLSP
jgi:hypothetical protein